MTFDTKRPLTRSSPPLPRSASLSKSRCGGLCMSNTVSHHAMGFINFICMLYLQVNTTKAYYQAQLLLGRQEHESVQHAWRSTCNCIAEDSGRSQCSTYMCSAGYGEAAQGKQNKVATICAGGNGVLRTREAERRVLAGREEEARQKFSPALVSLSASALACAAHNPSVSSFQASHPKASLQLYSKLMLQPTCSNNKKSSLLPT